MAASALKEIIEKAVQVPDSKIKGIQEEKKYHNLETQIDKCLVKMPVIGSRKIVLRSPGKMAIERECSPKEIDKTVELDSESDPNDGEFGENSDMLTTEDEAEDFLRHVLKESCGSDIGDKEESKGFFMSKNMIKNNNIKQRCKEESLNAASAITDSDYSPVRTFCDNFNDANTNKIRKANFEQESNNLIACVSSAKDCTPKNSTTGTVLLTETSSSSLQTEAGSVDIKEIYTDNDNTCTDYICRDTSIYNWSNKPFTTENKNLYSLEADLESISPELCSIMQLSPDVVYGNDFTDSCERLYSKQIPQPVRPSSTLNTPDPVCCSETDSNELGVCNIVSCGDSGLEIDLNNNIDADMDNNVGACFVSKGIKRKLSDIDTQEKNDSSPGILSRDVVTSFMNQGRPPDISTWKAVGPVDSQSNSISGDISNLWNKPTCTVQPFLNTEQSSFTKQNTKCSFYGRNQHCRMFTASIDNTYQPTVESSIEQQTNTQFNMNDGKLRSPCQYTSNQTSYFHNYRWQNSAAYRLDFSNPVSMDAPGILNFVSCSPYLDMNLTRPQALYARNICNVNMNSSYSGGLRFCNLPVRCSLNTGQLRDFEHLQAQDLQTVSVQNPCVNNLTDTSQVTENQPSTAQTITESQIDVFNPTKIEKSFQNTALTDKQNIYETEMSESIESSDNREGTNSSLDLTESNKTDSVGCGECDLVLKDVDTRKYGEKKDTDKTMYDTVTNKATVSEETYLSSFKVDTDTHDKNTKKNNIDLKSIMSVTGEQSKCCEEADMEKADDAGSPTPAHAYRQVKNKYFSEIYMQKCQTNSPITSFCTALDLSRKQEKKESKRTPRPVIPLNIRPYGEPSIPLSAVINSVQAPTLAYSGAMLVPYMNSIFAAMADLNKTQTGPKYSKVGTFSNAVKNSTLSGATPNANTVSQASSLTLNQQVLMQPNFLSVESTSCSQTFNNSQSTNTLPSRTVTLPTVKVNSFPLPMYTTPLQFPVHPLVSVVHSEGNSNDLHDTVSPYLYRLNIGLPIQTAANLACSVPATAINKNFDISKCPPNCKKGTKLATRAKKGNVETRRIKKSAKGAGGATSWKQSSRRCQTFDEASLQPSKNSIASVDRLNMCIQGSYFTSTRPAQSRNLTTYQPIPDGRLYRPLSDQKRKTFKAKHFPFCHLQIGTFKYICGPSNNDKVSRVKFLFSKRVMVYEFQLENPDVSHDLYKDMVEIEVPFSSIVSLWLYEKDMRVEVKEAPKSCLGKKGTDKTMKYRFCNAAVYDRKLRIDITNGQLCSVPYHYVQFKNCCADRLKTELREFDERFEMMLRLPLIEDPSKCLTKATKHLSSKLLDPSICLPDNDFVNNNKGCVYQPESSVVISMFVSCSCTDGCSAKPCQCCVKGTTCSEGICCCVNCRNPLNILHQLGLPAERAKTDPCLMENIYKIKRLDCYVKTKLMLECCNIPVLLFSCIPGEVRCVGPNCSTRYKYSWCTARLLNEDCTPRNHCVECGTCTDYRNVHCHRCNICYFAGNSLTAECPVCHYSSKKSLPQTIEPQQFCN